MSSIVINSIFLIASVTFVERQSNNSPTAKCEPFGNRPLILLAAFEGLDVDGATAP